MIALIEGKRERKKKQKTADHTTLVKGNEVNKKTD